MPLSQRPTSRLPTGLGGGGGSQNKFEQVGGGSRGSLVHFGNQFSIGGDDPQ